MYVVVLCVNVGQTPIGAGLSDSHMSRILDMTIMTSLLFIDTHTTHQNITADVCDHRKQGASAVVLPRG